MLSQLSSSSEIRAILSGETASAFKDHPFEVKNDDEMRAMVESVKDKGVTQAAMTGGVTSGQVGPKLAQTAETETEDSEDEE